jgi:CBS-domain-containing membrane protein
MPESPREPGSETGQRREESALRDRRTFGQWVHATLFQRARPPVRRAYRGGLWAELLLAFVPTGFVIGIFVGISHFGRQPVLFISLATSAFRIYLDPRGLMNQARVFLPAHLIGLSLGLLSSLLFRDPYVSGAIAMGLTIFLMVLLRIMFEPAIATSLIFAFRLYGERDVILFLFGVAMLAVLILIQRATSYLVHRVSGEA